MVETGSYNCYEYYVKNSAEYGDYTAVEYFGKTLNRSQFIKEIDSLAAFMTKEIGLKAGDIFTVFLPTTIQSFVALYALNKIGVIINFVHPLSPPDVLKQTMIEAKSRGIFILDVLSKKYCEVINSLNVPCIVCSVADYAAPVRKIGLKAVKSALKIINPSVKMRYNYSKAIKKYPPMPGVSGNSEDIAVYLNGGGTTGKSKTIKLTNKAINELAFKVAKIDKPLEPGIETSVLVLPLFHAFGICVGLHLLTCNGVRIIPMMDFNPKRFNAIMHKRRVVFIVGIPVMYKKLMREKNFDGKHLKNLRLLFCGGDDVSEASLDEFNVYLEKWGSDARLMRGYGLTEVASVCCTNTKDNFRTDSIGVPLEGIKMEIWDEDKKRVPNGTVGEIVISGSTIMEGYFTLDKPADEGVYTDENGVKWVQSGDLGTMDDDGYIFFAGRKKRLIIISGYNVFPGDVERVVEEFAFIREVCAVQGYQEGKPIVRLFISLKEKKDEAEVKQLITAACTEKLSHFSVPKEIVIMQELPRTHMKKVDFMALTEKLPRAN